MTQPSETADIHAILRRYWGYDNFRPLQEDIIRSVLDGHDTLALLPTGGGKSITYQVSGIALGGLTLVVTPLIALMKDQVEDLRRRHIPAEALHMGMSTEEIESVINKCLYTSVRFLYVSPERLTSRRFRGRLSQMPVRLIAVDEAHCISQWGYDFRPSYLRIAETREHFPNAPVLALTATATPAVAADIQHRLLFAAEHVLSASFRRPNLSYVVRKANDKLGETLHILSNLPSSAIVYVRKRVTAEELAAFLNAKGIRAAYYHAGLPPLQRAMRQEAWKKGECPVMVATNAFGMGIDKPDVRIVLHFDIPDSPEAYFQEAGRAGRDGKRAYAVLLYNEAALTACKKRVEKRFPDIKYVREIYRLLGNFFQVEEGAGKGFAFEFDPDLFVKTYQLDYVSALAAIETLQVSGYLECTTDIHARSQVQFLVLRDRLYGIEFHPPLQEKIVESILRTCAGVFVQPAYIEEEHIADALGTDRETVYLLLLDLAKRKIIRYVPGNDRPYIVYHQPRVPESYLHVSPDAYRDRKKSYTRKISRMVGYIETPVCRQLYLMDYFGQKEKAPCGICDYCLSQKKFAKAPDKKLLMQSILEHLRASDLDLRTLIYKVSADRDSVIACIRQLLEEGKITYKSPEILALK